MELPTIPSKQYFTISEAAHLSGVKAHVLRFWESEFTHLSPAKRRGGRRYYNREDLLIIRHIRHLLYDKGFTIQGAKLQVQQERRERKEKKPLTQVKSVASIDEIIAALKSMVTLLKE